MKTHVLFFSILLFVSCQNNSEPMMAEAAAPETESAAPANAAAASQSIPSDGFVHLKSKLIRSADFRFKTINVKKTTEIIEALPAKFPAYISSSALVMENGLIENRMTIRVQAEYFDSVLKEIDKNAIEIDRREVTTSDVGKEYVDLESRLRTKREVEARYMNILRKNTGTIEEILSAERQIGQIHEEIEATISRLNYLKEQISFSTIRLEFYEPLAPVAVTEDPLYRKFADAFISGLKGTLEILIALTYVWPLMILLVGIAFVYRLRKRRMTKTEITS